MTLMMSTQCRELFHFFLMNSLNILYVLDSFFSSTPDVNSSIMRAKADGSKHIPVVIDSSIPLERN